MFLAVDAGNTKVTFGFFDGDKIKHVESVTCPANTKCSDIEVMLKERFSNFRVDDCMISSVVDELTENLKNVISEFFSVTPLVLSQKLNYGIIFKSEHPEKYGADRVANAHAAAKLYEQRPLIVVDSGSATTFEVIDKNGVFSGGLIMPGMELQLKVLGEKTSKLPSLNLKSVSDDINIISNDTEEAIYAGVVVAHAQAVQGLLNLCEQKLGEKAFIVGTGGNINLVNKFMNERKIDVINPFLTLEGIKMIYELNKLLVCG